MPVLTSVKLLEWHVDYGATGFRDTTGCGQDGSGFPIYPYGDTQVLDLVVDGNVAGFEIVQDFRMSDWGAACNYRYEQRLQFFDDGRFRVVDGAYGRGCSDSAIYRPVVRIDLAVNGDEEDTFAFWDGSQWQKQTTELYRVPYEEAGHGPHGYTAEGYGGWVMDQSGKGYYIEPARGQFDDGGRGDEPFIYVTQHDPAEGDTDLGSFPPSYCCNDDERQGPDLFLNEEAIDGENIVFWYAPQHFTEVTTPNSDSYCWTVSGEPNPEAYPCFGGPMFVPFGQAGGEITAAFEVNAATVNFGQPVVFTNTSTSNVPVNYHWDFGDGMGTSIEVNPTYIYPTTGTFTATLTVDGFAWGVKTAARPITVLGERVYLPFAIR
jgi:PKD repeat protein